MEAQKTAIAKAIVSKKYIAGATVIPVFKLCYKTVAMKTA
jgi:hypothetical protein